MKAYTLSHWGIPVTVTLAAMGAAMAWVSTTTTDPAVQAVTLTAGICLAVSAIVLVLATAATRVKRDAADKRLSKYGCPRCGYAPHSDDIEREGYFPCPSCGEPIYPE